MAVRISRVETIVVNARMRNWVFVKVTTDQDGLIGWGEAFATGGLTAIFVAFVPQWLLTYSDARYLPRVRPGQS